MSVKYTLKYPHNGMIEFDTEQEREEYIKKNNIDTTKPYVIMHKWEGDEDED